MEKPLWGGRFERPPEEEVLAFSQSVDIDRRLLPYDVWLNQAHAIMLFRCGIIPKEVASPLLSALLELDQLVERGEFELDWRKEDVHMNVESWVREKVGPEIGGALHTARSRNDQVLADCRMYVREEILNAHEALSSLVQTLLEIGREHAETVTVGFTHTQHAQPITLGFWATSYASAFLRDLSRLERAFSVTNLNPLGACALAGTSLPIDRRLTTKLLGFEGMVRHALDAVQSRDFLLEVLFALASVALTLSRLAEEVVLWSAPEFGFLELDDAYAMGSSIMPQKKNPCVAELTRARTGRVLSALLQLSTVLKGIPSGYNRDLQEDKPPVWSAFDALIPSLRVMRGALSSARFKVGRMREMAGRGGTQATELANFLVRERGMPFRRAHEVVGEVAGRLARAGREFDDPEEVARLLSELGVRIEPDEIAPILDPSKLVRRQVSEGSTHPDEVLRMCEEMESSLRQSSEWREAKHRLIEGARSETRRTASEIASAEK